MKILHCIHTLDPRAGGVREFVEQVAAAQTRFGFSIEVATLDSPEREWCRHFPAVVHALGPGLLKYGYTGKWVAWLKENARRFDIVVINGIWQFHAYGTWQALKGTGVPYVVFPHGMLDKWFARRYPLKQLKKALYWTIAEHRVLEEAKAVLFSTSDECDRARGIFQPYRINEIVVGEPSAQAPPDTPALKDKFLSQFVHLQNRQFLLFLGRLHEKKGCDLLISAFAQLPPADSELHLVLSGPDDGYEKRLREQVSKLDESIKARVTFTGMLGDTRWGALSACQALVLPSHQENYGRVVTEALSCATPVLLSDQVNLSQEVSSNQAGLVCADSLRGVENMLQTFINMPAPAKATMRENARRLFDARFQSDNFFPKYLALLAKTAGIDSTVTPP